MEHADLSTYVPAFEIFIGGEPQPELRKSALSISINEKTGGEPSHLKLEVADKFDVSSQKFQWLEKFLSKESPLFNEGKKIDILMGYEGYFKDIISANLKTISTSGFSSNITTLTLDGFDASHKLLTSKATGSVEDSLNILKGDTYSEIAKRLADKSNLKSEIDKTSKYRDVTSKKYVTYMAFLKDAARLCGFEFFLTRNTLYFINPRKERGDKPILTLKWHDNLLDFIPRINTAGLVPIVEVWGHLPNSKKRVVKRATADQVDLVEQGSKGVMAGSKIAERLKHEKVKITNRNFSTEEEASDMAKAHLNITSDSVITASCSIVGNPDLTPGQYVKIEGIGRNLSGKYFVTEVTNTIDGNGYSTKFNVSRNNIVL